LLQQANADDMMWQTYVLTAVCAHEMGWMTAAENNYILAHELDAEGARNLLKALSPLLVDSFEKKGVFRAAEEWRHKKLVKNLLEAEAHIKAREQQEKNELEANKKTK